MIVDGQNDRNIIKEKFGINAEMFNMVYYYVRLSTVRLHLVVWYSHWSWQYNLQLTKHYNCCVNHYQWSTEKNNYINTTETNIWRKNKYNICDLQQST